jgi:hypothetical protein
MKTKKSPQIKKKDNDRVSRLYSILSVMEYIERLY